jgi:hypothetical protein
MIAITANEGAIGNDLMNRSLPCHLLLIGTAAGRDCSIGNPRHEYLPAHREELTAAARCIIEKWKLAGCPLDETVKHPSIRWARVIGGILKVNGYPDFLGNYGQRRAADDPVRTAIGLLGAARPDEWLRSSEWAQIALDIGVSRDLFTPSEREADAGRQRGIGRVFSRHELERFYVEIEDECLHLELQKGRQRLGAEGKIRYRFAVLDRELIAEDSREVLELDVNA